MLICESYLLVFIWSETYSCCEKVDGIMRYSCLQINYFSCILLFYKDIFTIIIFVIIIINHVYCILDLTHLFLVPYICVSESGQHWFRWWLVPYSAPSHYLNQCWVIVNWTIVNWTAILSRGYELIRSESRLTTLLHVPFETVLSEGYIRISTTPNTGFSFWIFVGHPSLRLTWPCHLSVQGWSKVIGLFSSFIFPWLIFWGNVWFSTRY